MDSFINLFNNMLKTTYTPNYKVYAHIVRHNYVLGGMLFTICKAQLHVPTINVGHQNLHTLHCYLPTDISAVSYYVASNGRIENDTIQS
jgi:hypothetical protein